MGDWEKYEVPDWVVDDYNSRVSEKDRIPLGRYGAGDSYDSYDSDDASVPMTKYGSYQKDRKKAELIEEEVPKLGTAIKGLLIALLELFCALILCYISLVISAGINGAL